MAVGVLTAAPEFTKQIYDDVTEKMFGHASPMREDDAPEGLIAHSAGQGEQGYYVYDIWESREAFERFMVEKLGPGLAEVMGGPPADVAGAIGRQEKVMALSAQRVRSVSFSSVERPALAPSSRTLVVFCSGNPQPRAHCYFSLAGHSSAPAGRPYGVQSSSRCSDVT